MDIGQISKWHEEYCQYSGKKKITGTIQIVEDISMSGTRAKFLINELQIGNFVLHINPEINEYVEMHRKAIIFHEFTHLYDFLENKEKYSNDDLIMFLNSCSELKASTIEMSVLLGLRNREQLFFSNGEIKIPYLKSETTLTDFITHKFATAIYTLTTPNLKPEILPVIPLCYYFGYMKVFSNGKGLVNNQLSAIETPLKRDIIKFSNLCWNNKTNFIMTAFKALEEKYIEVYIKPQFEP